MRRLIIRVNKSLTYGKDDDVRLVDTTIAEAAGRDLREDTGKRRALLLNGQWVVHVLVAQILDSGREVTEEN